MGNTKIVCGKYKNLQAVVRYKERINLTYNGLTRLRDISRYTYKCWLWPALTMTHNAIKRRTSIFHICSKNRNVTLSLKSFERKEHALLYSWFFSNSKVKSSNEFSTSTHSNDENPTMICHTCDFKVSYILAQNLSQIFGRWPETLR